MRQTKSPQLGTISTPFKDTFAPQTRYVDYTKLTRDIVTSLHILMSRKRVDYPHRPGILLATPYGIRFRRKEIRQQLIKPATIYISCGFLSGRCVDDLILWNILTATFLVTNTGCF